MAGKLSLYGGSLSGLRRSFCALPPGSGNAVYFVCEGEGILDEARLSQEFQNTKFPEQNEFPLPGKTISSYLYRVHKLPHRETKAWNKNTDVLTGKSRDQDQIGIISHFLQRETAPPSLAELTDEGGGAQTAALDKTTISMDNTGNRTLEEVVVGMRQGLEAKAQTVPTVLLAQFRDLFPNQPMEDWAGLTVLTLTQQSTQDMSAWSEEMEAERDMLTGDFLSLAGRAAAELTEAGYWADFIDPASGRPYLGPFTNATIFETDERYKHFGFRVEDLGCCKVVSHPLWGTKMFLGTLFTNAPSEAPEVQSILQRVNASLSKSDS